jgi:dihydroorotate dehydrogenase electron transfer subunit
MKTSLAQVDLLEEVQPGTFLLGLAAPNISREAKPGQFYMLKAAQGLDPFLPRPFSWLRKGEEGARRGHRVEILFQVVGKATALLARMRPGEKVQVVGPLGKGWEWDPARFPLLVGGGVGAASLVSLVEWIPPEARQAVWVLVGARSGRQLWCGQEISRMGAKVLLASQDGLEGFHGTVLELLKHEEARLLRAETEVFACGPREMLREVAKWSESKGLPCQVSLETPMACGVGVCLGCAVRLPGDGGYVRACKEGPVFRSQEIEWD